MAGPIETKVQASTGAAAVSGLALWALGHYVFKTGVPDVVASWIYVLVPSVLTFAAGYLAKHTSRPPAVPPRAEKTLQPKRGQDISPEPDPPMDDLPGPAATTEPPSSVSGLLAPPVVPPAAPE